MGICPSRGVGAGAEDAEFALRWVVAAQFAEHVGKILVVDFAHPFEPRDIARHHQIEIVDQPRHARIVAVRLLRLQREALGQRARAHAAQEDKYKLRHGMLPSFINLSLAQRILQIGKSINFLRR